MKRVLLVALAVLFAAGAAWAQFYDKLGADERRSLAEAYYLVGRQYAEQGDKAKGSEFQQMAYNIYPQLDPAAVSQKAEPSAAELVLAGRAVRAEAGQEEAAAVELLLKSRFLRLVSAFLAEDTPTLLSMMDGSVWFTKAGRSSPRRPSSRTWTPSSPRRTSPAAWPPRPCSTWTAWRCPR